ncbi:unnamed protein product [Paramecium sonneborni]|uniref:Uncharacterized protein n=1 Tax=Paramecium sonneborni TaxID=65129 RepID=A0A8S1QYF5_9CILI|nr:unnamed protein product [Paramecium sonneborni]
MIKIYNFKHLFKLCCNLLEILHFDQELLNKVNIFKKQLVYLQYENKGSFSTEKDFCAYFQQVDTRIIIKRQLNIFIQKEYNTNLKRYPKQIWRGIHFQSLKKSWKLNSQQIGTFIYCIVCHTQKGFIQISLLFKVIIHNMDAFTTIKKQLKDSLQLKKDRDIKLAFHPHT